MLPHVTPSRAVNHQSDKSFSVQYIKERFREASHVLNQQSPDIKTALGALNTIKGLGTPSFSSKQLRFLFPEICPILDSITKSLGYTFTPDGYERFAQDCASIARALEKATIPNPISRPSDTWFVGEIDMAIFAYLNGW